MVKLKISLLIILSIFLLLTVYVAIGASLIIKPAKAFSANLKASAAAVQTKDLNESETKLKAAEVDYQQITARFRLISWIRFIPLYGAYVSDAYHVLNAAGDGLATGQLVLDSIKPYADILGFSGVETQLNIQSAEEKIIFVLDTMDKISPQLETIGQSVAKIETEIKYINPRRYPQSLFGRPVRSQLSSAQKSLVAAKDSLANIKPLLTLLPKLLGEPDPQKYLLIFQNDAEMRGSGGFLTAYAILETHKGKITPLLSQDIYELDNKFGKRLPAPEPITKYLPLVYNWHLRDMNLSPDFKVSMDVFYPNYKEVAQYKDVNGIISMDTQFPVDLLKVLGPVGVSEWGTYSADIVPECNCPQIVYKMEDYATRPTYYIKANRKGMIGPLMHSILLNVMNSPKKLWPQFMEIALKNIQAKHIMFYFPDDAGMQQVAENFNATGKIKDFDGDYFHLNDTNFAGAKSNLYVNQAVDQEINVAGDGTITKTVTITYTNPQPPSDCNLESGGLCLNGLLRDWVRIYVPKGSELKEVLGSDIGPTTSEDLGKTVFEGFIELRPESKAKLIFKYQLPFKQASGQVYKLLLQKQPGVKNFNYTIKLNGQEETFALDADRELAW
ncbi:MAG: DUF4012 domain-containing protein [Patescibacteria group bacterium]